jgi:glycogen(starch) synthase
VKKATTTKVTDSREARFVEKWAVADTHVVMLSWEYPPKLIGGLARAVYDLSRALVRAGLKVTVITSPCDGRPDSYDDEGVHVRRVGPMWDPGRFMEWVAEWNQAVIGAGAALIEEDKSPRLLVHVHDWLAADAGIALKHRYHIPLVTTIHATEYGRNDGIHTDLQRAISDMEVELTTQAWHVLCCSAYMKDEIVNALRTPADKIEIVPNGVDREKFDFEFDQAAFRARFALPDERLIMFVGRMVREKGAQTIIESAARVIAEHPEARFVIAGGGDTEHLRGLAKFLKVEESVLFTGFIPDGDLIKLYRVADVALVPSFYEPFGIVALEAMAARCPVIVAEVGGLREIVEPEVSGTWVWPDRPDSLAWGILRALNQPVYVQAMAEAAYERVLTTFDWSRIARTTQFAYRRVWKEYCADPWSRESDLWGKGQTRDQRPETGKGTKRSQISDSRSQKSGKAKK